MPTEFDLVVIGSGTGGYVAAIRAAQLGLHVAVVERAGTLGGTCLNWGCIPTKALLEHAHAFSIAKHASQWGVTVGDGAVGIDMQQVQSRKDGIVAGLTKGVEFLFKKNGVELVHGQGRLASPNEVVVRGPEGDERRIETRHVLIATGSVPREVAIAPTDGERVVNSDHILELPRVPESLVVVGSGAVGSEFSSIFASFGSQVTLVEMLPRILPLEDEEVSAELEKAFRKRGITSLTEARLTGVEAAGDRLVVGIEGEKAPERLETDMLLVAIGRAPVTEGLGLEEAGVALDSRGYIEVSPLMQTTAGGVYAIGDVVATPWLAHVASAEGILAVEQMAGEEVRPLDYDQVPSVTYCEPEVGSVGLSEAEARDRGYDVAVGKFPFSASGKAAIEGKTQGFVKVVRETRYDQLLGVHIIGPKATDLIAEACVALRVEATTEELFRTIHAHPTLSEAMAEAAHAAVGQAIHI